MLIPIICVIAIAIYAWAAIPYLNAKPAGTHRATADTTTRSAIDSLVDARTKQREFAALLALTNELDATNFSLTLALGQVASLIAEQLDFDTLKLIESRLGKRLSPVESVTPSAINNAACQLERLMASCQTVCAMIDVGPSEPGDRSKENSGFVSLLARAKKRTSIIPFRMKEERRLITDASNDLVAAQYWLETASILVRRIPLQTRFAGLYVKR